MTRLCGGMNSEDDIYVGRKLVLLLTNLMKRGE